MMSDRDKRLNTLLSDDDRAVDEAADRLVDAMIETLEKDYRNELEPFEQYSMRVRLHLLKEIKNYSDRLVKGHLALLKELAEIDKN